jgi:hypothetical protein
MKAGQEWGPFPSLRRDLVEHILSGKAAREQTVEQRMHFGLAHSFSIPATHNTESGIVRRPRATLPRGLGDI